MRKALPERIVWCAVFLVFGLTAGFAQGILVPRGAVWKYFDQGIDLGTAWRGTGFADSAWASGPARLGYGGDGEVTPVSYGPDLNNKYVTTYFRKSFTVTNAAAFTTLTLNLLRDDGAVVYLNGAEVRRDNLPTGTITYTNFASSVIGGTDEQSYFATTLSGSTLINGLNVLAVEVHQANTNSSDIAFDLELRGTNVPPSVSISDPPNNANFPSGANLTLSASASDSDGAVTK